MDVERALQECELVVLNLEKDSSLDKIVST